MIKAIFFDLDETIIDALMCHRIAHQKAFEYFGVDYQKVLNKTKGLNLWGMRIKDILKIKRDAVGIIETQLPLAKLEKVRQDIFLKLVEKEAFLLPGVVSALTFARKNVKFIELVSSGTKIISRLQGVALEA